MDSEMQKIEQMMSENHATNGDKTLTGILSEHNFPKDSINTEKVFNSQVEIEQKKPFNRKEWFLALIEKLETIRNIEINDSKGIAFLKELEKDEYTELQAHAAELWILKGNWQYKKQQTLELSDFYPGKNEMAEFGKQVVCLDDIEKFATEIRSFFKEWAKGIFWSWKSQFFEGVNTDQYYSVDPEIIRLSSEVLAGKVIAGDLRQKVSKLTKGMQSQEEVIEKLKDKYHDLIVENQELAAKLE